MAEKKLIRMWYVSLHIYGSEAHVGPCQNGNLSAEDKARRKKKKRSETVVENVGGSADTASPEKLSEGKRKKKKTTADAGESGEATPSSEKREKRTKKKKAKKVGHGDTDLRTDAS